jgi:L-alanine-DL-glutamate epimerase-like enolase superfamily enzyme
MDDTRQGTRQVAPVQAAAPGASGDGTGRTMFDRRALVIDRVETLALRIPLARRYAGSDYSMVNRCTIVTRLHTADGLVSEVYNGDTDAEQAEIVRIIHEELAERVLGRSATDPEGLWVAMEPIARNILRDRALALQAIACIDTAVWDLFGKALGLPLHRLWGAVTDALPLSIIGGYYHVGADELPELFERFAGEFRGCKLKVGGLDPAGDARRVAIARAAAPDLELMVDANQAWNLTEAVDFGRRVVEYGIRWFEEPCRWSNDRRWMHDVRMMTGIPTCAGQSETALSGLRDLITDGAIDVSNLDASWAGGPTLWRKAAGLCAAFGIGLAHHEEPQLAGPLLASVPAYTFLECFERDRDPLFWEVTSLPSRVIDGHYRLPDGPGFGIELDPSIVGRTTAGHRVTPA